MQMKRGVSVLHPNHSRNTMYYISPLAHVYIISGTFVQGPNTTLKSYMENINSYSSTRGPIRNEMLQEISFTYYERMYPYGVVW